MCAEKSAFGCIKTLLITFNLFFVLIGLMCIGISCWTLLSPGSLFGISSPKLLHSAACVILITGVFLVSLAFLGCTGAALENRCLLTAFFTLLCGVFMGALVAGVLIAVFKDELFTLAVNRMSVGVQHEYGISAFWTEWIDLIQFQLQCCAVENYQASLYSRSAWYYRQTEPHFLITEDQPFGVTPKTGPWIVNVPASCCLLDQTGLAYKNLSVCQTGPVDAELNQFLSPHGCASAIATWIRMYAVPIMVLVVSMLLLLIIGLVFSLVLLRGYAADEYDNVNTTSILT
ncbi:hypothetical protein PHET_00420 [Paragonimus heterotremus]|uniref:Tetraspanin n=1 Tax=Paragonimus heterotremus TaxID=100268 RepID=A0A8J4T6Y8_9TREM|nr:hypothetical protein PHET_00420 [Paragonimus heterotremus]